MVASLQHVQHAIQQLELPGRLYALLLALGGGAVVGLRSGKEVWVVAHLQGAG